MSSGPLRGTSFVGDDDQTTYFPSLPPGTAGGGEEAGDCPVSGADTGVGAGATLGAATD